MKIPNIVKVIYIEDNEDMAGVVKELLEKSKRTKFIITHVVTLNEGIELIRNKLFDVVLLDMNLPNSKGIDTFTRLHHQSPDIPVIIVSGYEELGCEAVREGAQDFLLKRNMSTELLVRSIKYAIERKRFELTRLEQEEKLSMVIHSTPLGTHLYELVGDDLIFIGYNKSANRILNINHDELMNMKIEDAFPGLRFDIKDAYKNVILTGKAWDQEEVEHFENEINGVFEVHAFKISNNRMATQFVDITEKRKLEDELSKSRDMYQEIVESTHAAIYEICFETDRLTYVNDVMCELTGWSREELLTMSVSNLLTEESKLFWLDRYQSMLNGDVVDNTVEYEINIRNGSTKWVLLTASYKLDENGEVKGGRVIALDITDKKLAQLESKYKENLVYDDLEKKLLVWRRESVSNRQIQEQQLRDMDVRIMSMNNGVV